MDLTLKMIATTLVPFFISVSVCYLFGYWGAFQINVLEFVSFTDIGKLAVFPMVGSVVIGSVLFAVLDVTTSRPTMIDKDAGNSTPNRDFNFWRAICGLLIIGAALVINYMPEPANWFFATLLSIPLCLPLIHLRALVKALPNKDARTFAAVVIVLLPGLAFSFGRAEAYLVKTGTARLIVDVSRSNLALQGDMKNPPIYMGLLGETFVVFEPKTNSLVFIKQKGDSPLFLIARKK